MVAELKRGGEDEGGRGEEKRERRKTVTIQDMIGLQATK